MKWCVRKPIPVEPVNGIPEAVLQLLAHRGIRTKETVLQFLNPKTIKLPHPFSLPDAEAGIKRLAKAIVSNERICIYTDYDPDGHGSNAQLRLALRHLGVPDENVKTRIPEHDKEGYGLNSNAVREIAEEGYDLMVVADCGITSVKEVTLANELGLDIIIIDHHEPGPILPPAIAVIDPKRGDHEGTERELCAAGLVHVFLWGLFMELGRMGPADRQFLNDLVDLAGLSTIADMVPLQGANRRLAAMGLHKINERKRTGLRALLRAAGVDRDRFGDLKQITSYDVAMRIAPKINAGRRMDRSMLAARCLLSEDDEEAFLLAKQLCGLNDARRDRTDLAYREALEQVNPDDRFIVVIGDTWRKGVVGLVAQRLMQEFYRPVFAMTRGEDGNYTGSCRTIEGVNIHDVLMACKELFVKAGGHAAAGGFTIAEDKIDALRERLADIGQQYPADIFEPVLDIDLSLSLTELNTLRSFMPKLEPFGQGNPRPRILITGKVVESRAFGRDKERQHLEITLTDGQRTESFIGWGVASKYQNDEHVDLVVEWDSETFRISHLRPAQHLAALRA